jgi:1,2-phenylacetyl-CoA epoxidase PaaB subunit
MSDQAWISADGTLRPGIYYGMSDADYQAINALRASTMKEALQSAKQLHYRMHNRRPDSGALRLGRAVHLAVLQPEEYEGETARIPDEYATASGLSRKKPAQEWAAPLMASGVTVVSAAEDAKRKRTQSQAQCLSTPPQARCYRRRQGAKSQRSGTKRRHKGTR